MECKQKSFQKFCEKQKVLFCCDFSPKPFDQEKIKKCQEMGA